MTFKEAEKKIKEISDRMSRDKNVDNETLCAFSMALSALRKVRYLNLIWELRNCSSQGNCEACQRYKQPDGCDKLESDAADAIEEFLFHRYR